MQTSILGRSELVAEKNFFLLIRGHPSKMFHLMKEKFQTNFSSIKECLEVETNVYFYVIPMFSIINSQKLHVVTILK